MNRRGLLTVVALLVFLACIDVSLQQADMTQALVVLGVNASANPPVTLYKLFGNPDRYVPTLKDDSSETNSLLYVNWMQFSPYNAFGSMDVAYNRSLVLYGNDSSRLLSGGHYIGPVNTSYDYFHIPRYVFLPMEISNDTAAVAYDWISQNLYWLDGVNNHIGVVSTGASKRREYSSIVVTDIDCPGDIAVDPIHGRLFWTTGPCGKTMIMQSDLNGDNPMMMGGMTMTNCTYQLTVDVDTQLLYWLDMHNNRIGYMSYGGIWPPQWGYSTNPEFGFMTSLTTMGSYIVLCSPEWKTVNFYNKTTFALEGWTDQFEYPLMDIATYASANQPTPSPGSPCLTNNGGCSQLCFSMSPTTAQCGCQTNNELAADGITCVREYVTESPMFNSTSQPPDNGGFQSFQFNNRLLLLAVAAAIAGVWRF